MTSIRFVNEVDFVDVKLCIIAAHNQVMIVLKFKLKHIMFGKVCLT